MVKDGIPAARPSWCLTCLYAPLQERRRESPSTRLAFRGTLGTWAVVACEQEQAVACLGDGHGEKDARSAAHEA